MENTKLLELKALEKVIESASFQLTNIEGIVKSSKEIAEKFNVNSEFLDMEDKVFESFNLQPQIDYLKCLIAQKDKVKQLIEDIGSINEIELGMVVAIKSEHNTINTIHSFHQSDSNELKFSFNKFKIIDDERKSLAMALTVEQDYNRLGFTIVDKEGDYYVLIKNDEGKEHPFYVNETNLKKHFVLVSKQNITIHKTEFLVDEINEETLTDFTKLKVNINEKEVAFAGFGENQILGQTMICYHFEEITEPIKSVTISSSSYSEYYYLEFTKGRNNILRMRRGGKKILTENAKGIMQVLNQEEVKTWAQ